MFMVSLVFLYDLIGFFFLFRCVGSLHDGCVALGWLSMHFALGVYGATQSYLCSSIMIRIHLIIPLSSFTH